jgi:hypothetical protein
LLVGIPRRLLVAWLLLTRLLLIARRLFHPRSRRGRRNRLGDPVGPLVAVVPLGIVAGVLADRILPLLLGGVEGDGVAVRIAATTTATAATAATAALAGETRFAGLAFAGRTRLNAFVGIVREVGDRGGVEHLRFSRCSLRCSGDQVAGGDLLRFVRGNGGGGLTGGSRGAGRGEVSREHALERLDEVLLAEAAAVLDLVFASELSEILDAECGEIRLIRHVSNGPAQNAAHRPP